MNDGTSRGIDITVIDWCLYFVIVSERGKHTGFEDSDLQTGAVHIGSWSSFDDSFLPASVGPLPRPLTCQFLGQPLKALFLSSFSALEEVQKSL
jgi:hypothetical protein